MKHNEPSINAVPTNIITGFLGVGKTTVILHLLQHKPNNERWAVLVNEFGEIGIDGNLLEGMHGEKDGVFIREVPGGCMCCAAGLPMQIALNQLLSKAEPDRLLIEPTGLGHPKEVLEVLNAEHYQTVLEIQQSITLVDARKISDSRYTEHDTFNQQIDIADIIVGHKTDLYDENARQNLSEYVTNRRSEIVPIYFAEQGNIDAALLNGKSATADRIKHHHHHHAKSNTVNVNEQAIPESGFIKVENAGEGFQSVGWRFSPQKIFNRTALFRWLSGLNVERAKGVFITTEGIFGYNLTSDTMTEMELDDCIESRIEIIMPGKNDVKETELLSCLHNGNHS